MSSGRIYTVFIREVSLATALVLVSAFSLVLPGLAGAADTQVNTYTTSTQRVPSVSSDSLGNFVVVWNGYGGGSDTGYAIHGKRYTSGGVDITGDFQINSYTTGQQNDASVSMNSGGDFVVVWESDGSYGSDSDGPSIQAQRYDSVGSPEGSQFQVNSLTTSFQTDPAVAMTSSGSFMVVWRSTVSPGTDTDNSIVGQLYDSSGAPVGAEFQVNTYTTLDQTQPRIATTPGGDFVVTWISWYGSAGTDTSGASIQAQRFDSTGAAVGGEFQVNTYTTGQQADPDVAVESDGDFVIVWAGSVSGDSTGIAGQRFDSAGAAVGSEFTVNSLTTSVQAQPSVAIDSSGEFVIAWASQVGSGSDPGYSIEAQRYSAAGSAVGSQYQVNTLTADDQREPSVSTGGADFVVAWTDSIHDGSGEGVFASINPETGPTHLPTIDDAMIRAGSNSGNNYDPGNLATGQGCTTWCEAHQETLVKFDLSSQPVTTVGNAKLRLYLYDDGTWDNTGFIFVHLVTDDSWSESTVTWNTAPGPDWTEPQANAMAVAGGIGPHPAGWMEFDLDVATVQQELDGDGILSMRLVPDGTYQHYALFYSKEWTNSALHPQLVIAGVSAAPSVGPRGMLLLIGLTLVIGGVALARRRAGIGAARR